MARSSDLIQLSVRLDDELLMKIENSAEAACRPISREIVYRLKRSFEQQQPDPIAA